MSKQEQAAWLASKGDSLALQRLLDSSQPSKDSVKCALVALESAAQAGWADLLQPLIRFIESRDLEVCDSAALMATVREGNLDCAELLFGEWVVRETQGQAFEWALLHSPEMLALLSSLTAKSAPVAFSVLLWAAGHDRVGVIKTVMATCTRPTLCEIARLRNKCCQCGSAKALAFFLDYMPREYTDKMRSSDFVSASRGAHVEVVNMLKANVGSDVVLGSLVEAIEEDNVDIVQALITGCPNAITRSCFELAGIERASKVQAWLASQCGVGFLLATGEHAVRHLR